MSEQEHANWAVRLTVEDRDWVLKTIAEIKACLVLSGNARMQVGEVFVHVLEHYTETNENYLNVKAGKR